MRPRPLPLSDPTPAILDHYLLSYLEELKAGLEAIPANALASVLRVFERARLDRRQVFIIGNGGSAASAAHMACDLGKGTVDRDNLRAPRFRTISLSENSSLITAVANDLAFEDIFAEQLASLMNDGDVVVFISASGNSPNLLRAARYARLRGGELVGLLGFGGGALATLVDHPLVVSSRNYGVSEDSHLILQHVLTQYLRRLLAGPPRRAAFLDRDGVINERLAPHQYVTSWGEFRWVDGIVPLLRGLHEAGYALFVITNQQGLAKGHLSDAALEHIHREMTRTLAGEGISLTRILHCPHRAEDGCFCRKPRPGMIYRALNETPFLIDVAHSVLIGDTDADVQAGLAAGVGTRILVKDGERRTSAATSQVGHVRDVLAVVSGEAQPAEPQSTA